MSPFPSLSSLPPLAGPSSTPSAIPRYALRLLHVALISLRRAHHDHSALGVADSASSAVDRALRIVHDSVADKGDRADLLRKKPGRGELASVQDVAGWAWEQVRDGGVP